MFEGDRQRWVVTWDDLKGVVLRRHEWTPSLTFESLIVKARSGVRHRVPMISPSQGEIPNRLKILAHIELEGPLPIEREFRPRHPMPSGSDSVS